MRFGPKLFVWKGIKEWPKHMPVPLHFISTDQTMDLVIVISDSMASLMPETKESILFANTSDRGSESKWNSRVGLLVMAIIEMF